MLRKQVPDLDSLESPLISANPLGSILSVLPGSALAERIFNDPDSWQGADDYGDGDLEDTDAVKWLADEVGKYQAIGEGFGLSPIDRDVDIMLKPLPSEKLNLAGPTATGKPANWDDISREDKLPFPPLFDHTSLDLSLNVDLRFSKIWDARGKSFQSPVSPTNEPKVLDSVADARLTVPPALNLGAADNTLPPDMSPLNVVSASTTWSILEWYGVHPNTPRVHSRVPLLAHQYHTKSSAPSSLHGFTTPSANTTVTTTPPPSVPESTPIRRLPVIPDSVDRTSHRTSPTPSRTPTPPGGSTLTPQRTKSVEQLPQYIKTHQRSASATPPTGYSLRPRRTPHGSAMLPAPSSSPDPFNSSPSTPIRTGNLFTRSPPAGPRPRSSTNSSIRQRQASGRGSPSPIVIEPVPAPTHTHKFSSPFGHRL